MRALARCAFGCAPLKSFGCDCHQARPPWTTLILALVCARSLRCNTALTTTTMTTASSTPAMTFTGLAPPATSPGLAPAPPWREADKAAHLGEDAHFACGPL